LIPAYAQGFRRLGHDVTTVIGFRHPFYNDFVYDVDISYTAPDSIRWPEWVASSGSPLIRFPRGAVNRVTRAARWWSLVQRHDVFVFLWPAFSLTHGNREYPLLRRLGKKTVVVFLGSDIRDISAFLQQFPGLPKSVAFEQELREKCANLKGRDGTRFQDQLRTLRMAELHAHVILSQPNQSVLAVRPYVHLFQPVDLSAFVSRVPGREVPVVVHAPSNKGIKGTEAVLPALDRLRAEGVPFDLRLLHGVPNHEVLRQLTDADVAIDQLRLPLYGRFSLEAMASGCALATCNREDYEPYPPNRPIWHVDSDNIYEQLKRLLTDRDLRIRLAEGGRTYVERYHDDAVVARRIVDLARAEHVERYDHYPSFFAKEYQRPAGDVVPEDVQEMTTRIVRRWGLPSDVDPRDMIAQGLMSGRGIGAGVEPPRWRAATPGVPEANRLTELT
jgi:hypothetical protein